VRIITPDPLLPVSGGVGIPKPAKEKKGELFARALVLERGNTRVAIVNIDNLGWPSLLGDRARNLIKNIPPENILIGCTHTHSAPDAYGFADEQGNTGADMDYLDWCIQQVADAVNEAVEKLEPVHLKIAVGEAKGKIAYNYYAEKLYDPRCGVIQVIATTGENKGKSVATLVNYAIHPEVIGSEQGILTPDLCGPLYDRIESKAGGVALFMNGAIGGMVTADTRRAGGGENNTWEECIRIGELLADEALRIISSAQIQENPVLFCNYKDIQLPVDSELMRLILKYSSFKYDLGDNYQVTTRLNLLNIGTAQALTIPGEALPNIGYYLKRKMPGNQDFLFGLTNDAYGYILVKEDFNSFERYAYISRTSLGEHTGEIYIDECLDLIQSSPKPMKRIPKHGGIYVVAHRGAHKDIPENTLPAYRKAIDLGADYVEIDVRTSKDGEFVSIHNSTVDAYVSEITGQVKDFTLAELRALDIGSRVGPEWKGTRIPTFEEILQLCKGKCGIYLDLKEAPIPPLIELIKEYDMEHDVIWCLFDPEEIQEVASLCAECYPMPDPNPDDLAGFQVILDQVKPSVVAPVWRDFTKELVEMAHAAGALVIVDEKDRSSWQQALDWGADGIQTDHPEELIEYLKKM
jgi:glycerophosphoryl diester phosphodiesterase